MSVVVPTLPSLRHASTTKLVLTYCLQTNPGNGALHIYKTSLLKMQQYFVLKYLWSLCIFEQMLDDRTKLPVAHSYDEIIQAINNNSVTIIRGETGSGKTTQVMMKKFFLTSTPHDFIFESSFLMKKVNP